MGLLYYGSSPSLQLSLQRLSLSLGSVSSHGDYVQSQEWVKSRR